MSDNPALAAAVKEDHILPVYVFDQRDEFQIGGASKWWLHHSLKRLNESLEGKLQLFRGDASKLIPKLARTGKAKAVFWNKCYEPAFMETDAVVEESLQQMGVESHSYNGTLLWEPQELLKKDDTPYKVFSPFLKLALKKGPSRDLAPKRRDLSFSSVSLPGAVSLDQLKLLPTINWDDGIKAVWEPGEESARQQLRSFVSKKLPHYDGGRNYPARDVLSRLSPHLHYGEISPLQIWNAVHKEGGSKKDTAKFISELCWRDFSCHLLFHFPETATESYSPQLSRLQWQYNKALLRKWQKGQTGYPIVDAGMRELWQTGYMHNRVRMLTASFLIKNLLTDWRTGAAWFMDCLVDADLSVNTMNWQWVAGTGLDAAPFFRIFNPLLQSKKWDAEGEYIVKFVPELKALPPRYRHQPWTAPKKVLAAAGIELGENYPFPCIDLKDSTEAALEAYRKTKS